MVLTHVHLIRNINTFTPRNVIEVGSRDGKDAMIYAREFGIDDSCVIVFEPNPWLAEIIRLNYPFITVRQEAIGEIESDRMMYCVVPDANSQDCDLMYSGMSSLLERCEPNVMAGRATLEDVVVPVRKMSSLIEQLDIRSIDICKIDAEGTTLSVLKSFGDKITRVKSFHLEMEYRPYWKDQALAPEIKQYMAAFDFVLLSESYIGNTDQTDSIWVHQNFLS